MRPIFPQPGFVEQDLKDLLATRQFVSVSCYTITTKSGAVFRFTSGGQDVAVTSVEETPVPVVFSSKTVLMEGITFEAAVGVEVVEQEIKASFGDSAEIFGMPVARALKWGRLDGSIVKTDRFYAAAWGSPRNPTQWVAGVPIFRGRLSTADKISRYSAVLKVKSEMVLLNERIPRKLQQPGCNHTFGDEGCGFDRAAAADTGSTETGSDAIRLVWSSAAASHALGTVLIEDGDGFTSVRTVRSVEAGTAINLASPLDFTPPVGREFQVLPGCSRTRERCEELGNIDHFQGFPFVPVAEMAY